jgi:hypothetical protein
MKRPLAASAYEFPAPEKGVLVLLGCSATSVASISVSPVAGTNRMFKAFLGVFPWRASRGDLGIRKIANGIGVGVATVQPTSKDCFRNLGRKRLDCAEAPRRQLHVP